MLLLLHSELTARQTQVERVKVVEKKLRSLLDLSS